MSARRLALRKDCATTWAMSLPRASLLASSQPGVPALRLVVWPGVRTRHRASVAVPMVCFFSSSTWPE